MFTLVCFILCAYARLVNSADQNNGSQVQNIYLLAGQSNMSGRGGVINETWDGVVPLQSQPNSTILRLSANLTWAEAQEPLHKDIDAKKICGVGPGLAFAKSMLQRDPSLGVIGLVPCAIGGTRISEWGRGSVLYNHLMRRAEAALLSGGTIRALLWYQGESDTNTPKEAKQYKMKLKRFFKDVRADLKLSSLPIIQVALATGEGPYIETVREAQMGLQLPNVKCIDAKGLSVQPDHLHLTTPAQVRLGENFADALVQSATPPVQSSPPPVQSCAFRGLHNFVLDSIFRGILFR